MDKMPAYSWRDAIRLAAFLKGIGPEIAEALEPKMTAVLKEGEQLPDVAHLLHVLGRMVVAKEARYDRADYEKHRHGARGLDHPRHVRPGDRLLRPEEPGSHQAQDPAGERRGFSPATPGPRKEETGFRAGR